MPPVAIPFLTAAAVLACALAAPAAAQSGARYPEKLVRIVVPYPAGGTADAIPRIVGEKLSAKWGQPVIIENKPGAGGNIGADLVARSDPDGHTLIASPPAPFAVNGSLYKKLTYDPAKWVPVSLVATMPNVLAVRTKLPANSVKDVINLAKKDPGKLTYASQGSGTTSHLTASMFQQMANVELLHVPYKGTAPAMTALMAGQVDIFFDNITSSLAQHQGGKIKILAVASTKRVKSLPEVPTIAESGLPGFNSGTWVAFAAPPGTPAAIANAISRALAEAVQHPEVQERFAALSADPIGSTPAEMASFVREESERWSKVIKSANVTVD